MLVHRTADRFRSRRLPALVLGVFLLLFPGAPPAHAGLRETAQHYGAVIRSWFESSGLAEWWRSWFKSDAAEAETETQPPVPDGPAAPTEPALRTETHWVDPLVHLDEVLSRSRFARTRLGISASEYRGVRSEELSRAIAWSWETLAEAWWLWDLDTRFAPGSVFAVNDTERLYPPDVDVVTETVATRLKTFWEDVLADRLPHQFTPFADNEALIPLYVRRAILLTQAAANHPEPALVSYIHPNLVSGIYVDPFARELVYFTNEGNLITRENIHRWITIVERMTGVKEEWSGPVGFATANLRSFVDWTPETRQRRYQRYSVADPAPYGFIQEFPGERFVIPLNEASIAQIQALLHVVVEVTENRPVGEAEIALAQEKWVVSGEACEARMGQPPALPAPDPELPAFLPPLTARAPDPAPVPAPPPMGTEPRTPGFSGEIEQARVRPVPPEALPPGRAPEPELNPGPAFVPTRRGAPPEADAGSNARPVPSYQGRVHPGWGRPPRGTAPPQPKGPPRKR